MSQNPILKVLSTLKKYQVEHLLIGGQACIIYGAAEFSRDSDFIILATSKNLKRLKNALNHLKAELIYVPPLKVEYLRRGHACHFRCKAKDVENLRIDVISKLRGCDSFTKMWKRRKVTTLKNGSSIDIINLCDLLQSKKTQRDKDWLMLKRLVENDISLNINNPSDEQLKFWFYESRNPEHLIELARKYPKTLRKCLKNRPLLSYAVSGNLEKLKKKLYEEELNERQKDSKYWEPLKKELEVLRHKYAKNIHNI